MPKFYVQCGPVRTILLADSAEHAALAALDGTLQNHLWIYDDPQLCLQQCQDHLMCEALLHLCPTVRVSERGFDRQDALQVGVPEVICRWHQLMVGMHRLFAAAGLAPRSMQTVAATKMAQSLMPRLPR
ncbi:MAG: hypothetical protein MI861_25190 [Pirellulales bacterium]|nr:hypothetical protein [Pirellulales bacterium]